MLRPLLASLLLGILLGACGGGGDSDEPEVSPTMQGTDSTATAPAGATSPAPTSPSGSGGDDDSLATVHVVITAGAKEGEYEIDLVNSGGCSRGAYGPNTFTVASVDVEGTESFDGPQSTIFDVSAAAQGTDQFGLALAFDNFAVNLLMSPIEGFGSGTLTLDDKGNTATIHAEGLLEDGSPATVDIECHKVSTF